MEEFLQFYNLYPRKVAKGQAYRTWCKLKEEKILPELDVILDAINARTKAKAWPEKTYIQHPSTWLNAWGWDDEIETIAETPWHETASGIEAKGRELGLDPSQFDHWQAFKVAVMQKSLKAA